MHAWQECTRGLPSADHVFLLPESSMLALIFSSFLPGERQGSAAQW